jgi:hypothetical protein
VSIPRVVFLQIRVQQIDGYLPTIDTLNPVSPGTYVNKAILQRHWDTLRQSFQSIFRVPGGGFLVLLAVLIESLSEVTVSMKEGYGHHRDS